MTFDYFDYKYIARLEYQNLKQFLNKTTDHSLSFRKTKWVEINYNVWRIYKAGKQVKFYTLMQKSSLP